MRSAESPGICQLWMSVLNTGAYRARTRKACALESFDTVQANIELFLTVFLPCENNHVSADNHSPPNDDPFAGH